MLFPYTYVPHSMEKMQSFIDFIFFEVWCKAPIGEKFNLDLFAANPDLKEVMSAFGFAEKAPTHGKAFYKNTKAIYELFAQLSPADIKQFKKWYWGNNDLKKVCANNPAAHLVRYTDITAHHPLLSAQLDAFFKSIYSDVLGLAAIKAKIGDIKNHYHTFAQTNQLDTCPFCGLSNLLGPDHDPREAYDHYLPKAIYPFNAVNFHNLMPACHHCNSSYKGSKDPARTPKTPSSGQIRRRFFYPFSTQPWHIDLKVHLHHADATHLRHSDIDLKFGPAELTEQIDTWKDVYGIDGRYRAKLCGPGAKAWAMEVLDEWRWYNESDGKGGKTPQAYLRDVARHTERAAYTNINFLKLGFLQACEAAGAFREVDEVKTT